MSTTASQAAERSGSSRRSKPSRGGRSHSHRYSRSQRKILKLLIVSWVLGGLLFIVILVWIMTSMKLSAVNGDLLLEKARTREQIEANRQLEAEKRQLEQQISQLEQERAELVEKRIPHLRPLQFDVTIPIDKEYFRNINFTLTGTDHNRHYEYRAVIHNDGSASVEPDVTLFLFDELGIEVGKTRLSGKDTKAGTEAPTLQPGETRSYSSEIRLQRQADPKYFLIDVR